MTDEGYIKFQANWEKAPPLPAEKLLEINHWRGVMYRHGLIGAYPDGIGFGNISQRWGEGHQFVISGSATGNFPILAAEHYSLVSQVELGKNTLHCKGPIIASSESMSHAVIYRECPEVHGVIHIHHLGLWEKLLNQVPTTDSSASYGSPEMAFSIIRLLKKTDLRQQKIFVMEGHREGVFAFGGDLKESAQVVLAHLSK